MVLIGLARCSFSVESCTRRGVLFGGGRLAARVPLGRFAALWSRHGAAWGSWGSERTGQAFYLWQSVQFCWCRGPVSNLRFGPLFVTWARPFDDPVPTPKGKTLATLKHAAGGARPTARARPPNWHAQCPRIGRSGGASTDRSV